eukprot:IDg17228t1
MSRLNPLYGCAAALDGIAVEITKLLDYYVPQNFYFRKGIYALPVQALFDSDYCFRFMSHKCVGSTQNSLAFGFHLWSGDYEIVRWFLDFGLLKMLPIHV